MPYITQTARHELFTRMAETPGELNYEITQLIALYWGEGPPNYQRINDIVGALESAKAEFQRRVVAPYENAKIKENGDVY
jgi:hypothetical protein